MGRISRSLALVAAVALSSAGCGTGPPKAGNSTAEAVASTNDNSGLSLPPGFKPVDIPVETRKQVFNEAHKIRALAVQEANLELPMDEASLPVGNTAAFDKRVADHKVIMNGILNKNLPTLAEKYKIRVADIEKIEEEANKLRWLPPQDPVLETKPEEGGSKAKPGVGSKPENKDEPRAKTSETK